MKRVIVLLQTFFLFFIFVGNAIAGNINIISSEREVSAYANAVSVEDSDSASTTSLGPWNEEVWAWATFDSEFGEPAWANAYAGQDSSITLDNALVIDASGGTRVESDGWFGEGYSVLYVTFDVANQTTYDLSITTLNEDSGGFSSVFLGTASGSRDIFDYNVFHSGNTYAGTLESDTYYFGIRSETMMSYSDITYDIQFTVSNVPIPSAIWLLGSAFIGLVGFRKFRREA